MMAKATLLTSYAREMGDAGLNEADPARAEQHRSLSATLTKLAALERIFDKLDAFDKADKGGETLA